MDTGPTATNYECFVCPIILNRQLVTKEEFLAYLRDCCGLQKDPKIEETQNTLIVGPHIVQGGASALLLHLQVAVNGYADYWRVQTPNTTTGLYTISTASDLLLEMTHNTPEQKTIEDVVFESTYGEQTPVVWEQVQCTCRHCLTKLCSRMPPFRFRIEQPTPNGIRVKYRMHTNNTRPDHRPRLV